MTTMQITIGHLYPRSMNTYGDTGNIICLRQRGAWRGIEVKVIGLEIGDPVPEGIDLYFFGGGQDAAQGPVGTDLLKLKGGKLKEEAAAGKGILAICGGYQLLGASYLPFEGEPIEGLGIFPVETKASKKRSIGNIVVKADPSLGLPAGSTLVGFENHSGQTSFTSQATPLGSVLHGSGNNGEDRTEGCVQGNAIGCYLHGSLLPKNPHLADLLIQTACRRHDPSYVLAPLDDTAEWAAHNALVARYAKA